jgi:uncharacterized membrane protein YedE/YeeE
MKALVGLLSGLVFGLGLAISGMINPTRVLGFLDFAGDWDPSLAFVLAGAVTTSMIGVAFARRCPRPMVGERFNWPSASKLDRRLLIGAALFGVGWGLAGFCPGPAIASLSLGYGKSVLFVAAMLVGMALYRATMRPRERS